MTIASDAWALVRSVAERELAGIISSPQLSAAAKNKSIPPAEKKIAKARGAVTTAKAALNGIPARLPANQVTPGAQKAVLRARRRSPQTVLRLLAASAEHWLGNHLNDYLRDNNEYRAITRNLSTPAGRSATPRQRSPSPSASPPHYASPEFSGWSSTRSTPPRPAYPATPGPSPTSSHPGPG